MTDRGRGNLFIVAAPSGGGKTSLVKQVLDNLSNIVVSVSHTTRPMRPGEKDGADYFFIDQARFQQMIDEGCFVEYAHVFGHYYGTSTAQIQDRLAAGIDVILDIDWQGAGQIRRLFPEAVSVFVVPPSLDELKNRLHARGQDDAAVIAQRMNQAKDEMSHLMEFDYLLVNDNFATAANELTAIIQANRLEISRQKLKFAKLLSFLLAAQ